MRHKGGDTWLSCTQCDKRLEPEVIQDGRWVSEYPGRDIVGYSVSQLMVTSISAKLYNDSNNDNEEFLQSPAWKTIYPGNGRNI